MASAPAPAPGPASPTGSGSGMGMGMPDAIEIQGHRDPITLTRWILTEQTKHADAHGEFTVLLQSIQLAVKVIANANKKAGVFNLYGVAGGAENSSGDVQKKLDIFSNEAFVNCLAFSQQIAVMVSEEHEEPVLVKDGVGKYAICFDPLDGSSNIDANVSVGTIFAIYRKEDGKGAPSLKDVLRPGREMACAGYALYGAATMMVLSLGRGNGVHGFTLDPSLGEFVLTHPNMRIPKAGAIYSINEGNAATWDEATTQFVKNCKYPPKSKKAKSARYIGSMVSDVHRTILYGGIFCYPGDKKNPNGKLRLLYEGNPMAFIVEEAGGKATTGTMRILDIQPKKIHQRTPIFLGSPDDVEEVLALYQKHPAAPAAPAAKL